MNKINTHWSQPKTNFFSALWSLKAALNAGHNARLIKMRNEDCKYPIKIKNADIDFRNYDFQIGLFKTRQEVIDDPNESEFSKHLTLNYKTCYGTVEAVESYYETGHLTIDNFKGFGVSHLVKIDDIIRFWKSHPDVEKQKRAENHIHQYRSPEGLNYSTLYHFYKSKSNSSYEIKHFKRKLSVVELLEGKPDKIPVAIRILNWVCYPLKFIPKKSVLKMPTYTNYSFSIGNNADGFKFEFQIPKRFSFQ